MPTHAALTAHDHARVLHTDTHKWFAHGCTRCSTDSVTCTKHTMSSGEVTSTPYTHTACTRAQALSVHLHSPPMSNCSCTGCTPTVRARRCGAHPTPVCMHRCCGHTQSTNRSSDTAVHPSADTWGPAMPLHVAVHLSQLCSSTQTHSKATCVPPAVSSGGLTHPPLPPPRSPPGGTALGTDGAVTSAPRATGTHCGQRPRRWRRSRARWAAVRLRERWCCCCPSRCCWPSAGPGTASPAHASEWPRRCPVGRDGGSDAKT